MKFGIIGCGLITETGHAPAIVASRLASLAATADTNSSRARAVGNCADLSDDDCYTDYRALLDRNDVDAVTIGTPPSVRLEIVLAAATAGKHVLVEKPIATTVEDAQVMQSACDDARVVFAVTHNYLYYPEHQLAKRILDEGDIGELRYSEFVGLGSRPSTGTNDYKPGWRYDLSTAGGGVILDLGIHGFYLAEMFHNSAIVSVDAHMDFASPGIDNATFCRLQMENSSLSLVNLAWGHGRGGLDLYGSQGFISYLYRDSARTFSGEVAALRVKVGDRTSILQVERGARPMFASAMYDDFVTAVESKDSDYSLLASRGIQGLKVVRAAYESVAQSNQRVPLS